MAYTILIKRGAAASIPTLHHGEPYWAHDTNTLYIGDPGGNVPIAVGGGVYVLKAGDTMTGALTVDGSADETQLIVQGHSTQNNNLIEFQNSASTVIASISGVGAVLFQNTTDSTTGFQILDTNGGTPIFNVDTLNERVGIGTDAPDAKLEIVNSQIILDDIARFATSKFNSQGTAWSSASTLQGIVLQGSASSRGEISWYRGSRTYPEASIRQHITADTGLQIWVSGGTTAPKIAFHALWNSGEPKCRIGDPLEPAAFEIEGAAGAARDIRILSAGSNRWLIRANATAEGGSDVGSDFEIHARTDAGGAFGHVPFHIKRSNQRVGIGGLPSTAKLEVTGKADEVQLLVIANATQTSNILELQDSAFNVQVSIDGNGGAVFNSEGNDANFQIQTNNDANALTIDGGQDSVGVGVALAGHTGKLHVDQTSATGAKPVITLDQGDLSEEFIRLIGESTTDASQSLVDAVDMATPGTIQGWFKIYVQDDQATNPITDSIYYVPFYSAPTA